MLRIMSKKKTVWLRNKTRKTEFDIIIEKDGRSKHIFVVGNNSQYIKSF